MQLRRRPVGSTAGYPTDLHPLLRRLYAQRGVAASELSLELSGLLPPQGLLGIDIAARLLADAIAARQRIVIAADYDSDGATGCALAVLGLRALGATEVGYVVPDRFRMGYGLSPALVDLAVAEGAAVLVTVDNGITGLEGVAHAKARGLTVIITDHHLPGPVLPAADAIVNPHQPGCRFASRSIAGVGVMFYLLLALRIELRQRRAFGAGTGPNLAEWLDLVALGTVADVVRLDHNNRILVEQGLQRLRRGRARPGLLALLHVAGRPPESLSATDLGFVLSPRLNAAGRLDDMRAGIECLLAPDFTRAMPLAQTLDRLNRERRSLTSTMSDSALAVTAGTDAVGICAFDIDWHEGVVGLVAAKLKERWHRPAIAFARAQETGALKGSARSISGCNVRDLIARVDGRESGLVLRFGGHAMAAGLTLREADYSRFAEAFDAACREMIDVAVLERITETDGTLEAAELTVETALCLEGAGPWGQGFPAPLFEAQVTIVAVRAMGSEQQHIRYQLRSGDGPELEAVDFGGAVRALPVGSSAQLVYALEVNRYNGRERLQLRVQHIEPVP